MKFGFFLLTFLISQVTATVASNEVYNLVSRDVDIVARTDLIFDNLELDPIYKRDGAATLLIQQLAQSGAIFNILHSLNNNTQVLAYYQLLAPLLNSSSNSTSGLDINAIIGQVLELAVSSGLLDTTIKSLIFNDTNLYTLAEFVNEILSAPSNAWIGWLVLALGDGEDLTVGLINRLIKENAVKQAQLGNKNVQDSNVFYKREITEDEVFSRELNLINSLFEREEKDLVLERSIDELFDKRAGETSGSAALFLNNIVGMVVNSTLLAGVFQALNETNFITNFVLQFINDTQAQSGILNVISLANATGLFNNIDLNYYFQHAKEQDQISDAVEFIISDPLYAPRVGKLLSDVEKMGGMENIRYNMYGPKNN